MTVELRRASSPRSMPARGHAGLSLSVSPEGACGTPGRFTAPAAPGLPTRNRHTWRPVPGHRAAVARESIRRGHQVKAARHGSRYYACVPHADGFCGLLHVPRNCRFCRHAAWFGRTAARTCTWTVRPPACRRLIALVPAAPGRSIRNPRALRPGIVAATAIPLHDMKTLMRRPLPERDGGVIFLAFADQRPARSDLKTICRVNEL